MERFGKKMRKNQRAPRDVLIMGIVSIIVGALFLISGLARFCGPVDPAKSQMIHVAFFGLVRLHSRFCIGAYELLIACASFIVGYGLIKRRAWGWWIMIVLIINGIPSSVANASIISLAMTGVFLLWGLFRINLYHPFGMRLIASGNNGNKSVPTENPG